MKKEKQKKTKNDINPRNEIINFCEEFKARLLDKWDRGEKEHGNNWGSVNVHKELTNEVIDIINYHMIYKAQLFYKASKDLK